MEFDEYGSGDDHERRAGDGRGHGQRDDFSGLRGHQRIDESHGDGARTGVDCSNAGESLDYQECHAAVYGHGNLQRQQHAKPDKFGDLEFDEYGSGDD